MTISSERQLEHTQAAIAKLEKAIAEAKRRLGNQPQALADLVSLHHHQIEELRAEIRDFLGMEDQPSAAFELTFETEGHAAGTASMSILAQVIRDFRGALTAVAEALSAGVERAAGRPPVQIANAVDLSVVGFGRGSFKVLMELPAQRSVDHLADRALGAIQAAAEWVAADGDPPEEISDAAVRNVALRRLQRLAPSEGSGLSWVEIGRDRHGRRKRVRLDSETRRRATAVLEADLAVETISVSGVLRAIDLDRKRFEIKDADGHRHKCEVPDDLLSDAIEHISSQQLIVARLRKQGRKQTASTLDPVRRAPAE